MTIKTWNNAAGGSWETATDWTPNGIPGDSDDALINGTGTYTVTMGAIEFPNSVTVSDPAATLSIGAGGQFFGSLLTINAGTLALAGAIVGATVIDNGGAFLGAGGTLDGVTWQGPLVGSGNSAQTLNIKDGITLLNAAGTGPGTLDVSTLYQVYILDSTPLSNLTINLDAFNIEHLSGPASGALVVDTSTTINQSATNGPGNYAQISGAQLINNGTISATSSNMQMFIQSVIFDNTGTLLDADGDRVMIQDSLANTGTMEVTSTGTLTISDTSPNALSNSTTIAVSNDSSLIVSGSLGGGGVITLANLSVADMHNTNNAVTFLDSKDTLRLEAPGSFTGDVAGMVKGDKIDLVATPVTKLNYAGSTASGVLTVMNNTTTVAALNLLGDYLQSTFAFGSDGTTGNDISVAVSTIAPRTLDWTGANGTTAFSAPANWNDVSDALNPALTAPTLVDTVVFDTSGGAVSGSGTVAAADVGSSGTGVLELTNGTTLIAGKFDAGVLAADVGQIGLSGAGTEINITGAATVADAGTGILSVLSSATFAAASLTIGANKGSSGAVIVSGSGSDLVVSGALNIGTALGTGDLTVGPSAAVHASVINLDGQVVLEGGLLDPSVTVINPNKSLGGSGTVASGDIIDEGILQAGDGTPGQLELVQGTIVGGGTLTENGSKVANKANAVGVLQINTFGTMEVDGAVLNAATTTFANDVTPATTYTVTHSVIDVNFEDSTGVLQLDDIAGFRGTIATFQAGDQFIISGGTLSGLGVNNGSTLTIADSGNGGTDQIIFGSPVSASYFNIVAGNTIAVVACFAAGTLIETETGPAAVETLRVGDEVRTLLGGPGHIVWAGSRTVDCTRHPRPETVWPVRIARGAFGTNLPSRDLFVSPDHAIYVDGVLVPAKHLLNGTAIRQVKRKRVVYHHIELARHDVVFAEGLPAETYLGFGDRAEFSGAQVTALHPDFTARSWEMAGSAPLVVTGERLEAVRARYLSVPRKQSAA